MKIRNRVILSIISCCLVTFVLGAILLLTYRQTEEIDNRGDLAEKLLVESYKLAELSNDYILFREKRPAVQWEQKYRGLAALLSRLKAGNREQQVLIDNIAASHARLREIFDHVRTTLEDSVPDVKEGNNIKFLQASWVRLTLQTQAMIVNASQLANVTRAEMRQIDYQTNVLVIALIGSLVLVVVANYLFINVRILTSMDALQKGTTRIGTGDLNYRIEENSEDEIGALARAFNQMTLNLSKVLASKEELDREVVQRKRAEGLIREMNENLERKVRERTAQLEKEIEERKSIERALRDSESQYRVLYELSADGILLLDDNGVILDGNQASLEMFGYSMDEIRGTKVADLIHPDDIATTPFKLVEVTEGQLLHIDRLMRKRDGSYIPVEVSGRRVADNLIQRLYRDITERRLTEEMRKEALAQGEMLEKIFSTTHICVVVMDTQFNFIRVNQSYANACGYPPEFFPSKNVFQLYPHAENERIFKKVVETGEPFTVYASPLEFPDFPDRGVTYWDWTLQPVKDSRGGVEGLILVLLDVTERERANAVVRESERKFRLVTETIEDVFWIGNPGARQVEYISPAFEKIWGRSLESLYASPRTFLDAVHPDDLENLKKTVEEAQTAGRNYTFEYRIIGNGGSVRWIEERGFPIRDDAGNLVLVCGVCKDISDRKRTEKLLMLRAEDLARSNRDLEQFAYFMSHDLKEPLRNVATCLQMLKKEHLNKLGPDADQLMGYAEDSVAGMKVMIQDLLTYSRVTTRGNVPKRTDCERVLRQTLLNLRATILETGAIITHDPLPTVTVDATQLVLLLQNLIGNALKFQGHNSPLVHVSAVKLGNEWQFSVRDNGIGIPAKYLQRIFMIFQRLHNKSKYPGSGMGLALVKRITERHGGRVWADSKPNKGTTFYFTIPAD